MGDSVAGDFDDSSPIEASQQSTIKLEGFDETLRPRTSGVDGIPEEPWQGSEDINPNLAAFSVFSSTDPGKPRHQGKERLELHSIGFVKERNRSKARSGLGENGRCWSAPLLPASQSTHASTWYSTTTGGTGTIRGTSMWRPLGSTWRDWECDEHGDSMRKNVDDCANFRDGVVPKWSKECNTRKLHILEHELTWAYYRMKRHHAHPHRKEVGDPSLPPEHVVEAMRHGKGNQFQFWRDIRPPFNVASVHRLHEEVSAGQHPDGDLFEVVFQCGIDYVSERLWGLKSDGGTFNNRIHSSARVRIPDGFPRRRHLTLVSWGSPQLNYQPGGGDDDEDGNRSKLVQIDPNKWMPISDELKVRANLSRFASCREATKRADAHTRRKGRRAGSLPSKESKDPELAHLSEEAREAAVARLVQEGLAFPTKKIKPRQHRIFTSAAGFVRYVG